MDGLELLGATEALSSQYITLRIKSIDAQTLKYKLGGAAGNLAPAALLMVSAGPQMALDVAAPFIRSEMKNYGIDADVTISNVPPTKGGPRAISEFWPGLLVGGALGGSCLLIAKLIARLFARR